ncbi:MAG: hypothetical protein WDW38_009001 [Sanguina aurantia]
MSKFSYRRRSIVERATMTVLPQIFKRPPKTRAMNFKSTPTASAFEDSLAYLPMPVDAHQFPDAVDASGKPIVKPPTPVGTPQSGSAAGITSASAGGKLGAGEVSAEGIEIQALTCRLLSLPDIVCRSASGDMFLVNLSRVQQLLHEKQLGLDGLVELSRICPTLVDAAAMAKARGRSGLEMAPQPRRNAHNSKLNCAISTVATSKESTESSLLAAHEQLQDIDPEVLRHLAGTDVMVEELRQRLSQEVLLRGMEEERVAVLAQAPLQAERQAAVVKQAWRGLTHV